MRRTSYLTTVCVMLASGLAGAAVGPLWTETFSTDPFAGAWTSNKNFTWDFVNQQVYNRANYDNGGYMYRPISRTLTDTGDFGFSADIYYNYNYWSGDALFGLVNGSGNGKIVVRTATSWPNDGDYSYYRYFYLELTDADGTALPKRQHQWP